MAITMRTSQAIETWLAETFSTKTAGAEYIIKVCQQIYRKMATRFEKLFNKEELRLIMSIVKDHNFNPAIAGHEIEIIICNNADLFDNDQILSKIKSLSITEKSFLEIWLKAFWQNHE